MVVFKDLNGEIEVFDPGIRYFSRHDDGLVFTRIFRVVVEAVFFSAFLIKVSSKERCLTHDEDRIVDMSGLKNVVILSSVDIIAFEIGFGDSSVLVIKLEIVLVLL